MTSNDILQLRLRNQQIISSRFTNPGELLQWLCGIQSQEYVSSKWALGIRLPAITDSDIEQEITNHTIIRSWIFRGTLHLVAAKDIRWLLDLLAPRIMKSAASRHRQLELDEETFRLSNKVISRVLSGGNQLSREELAVEFQKAGIITQGQRLVHILQRAALEQLICFGVRKGKEYTFTKLDEIVPVAGTLSREEALSELAKRYFTTRGPASLQDFAWWSGLGVSDARNGIGGAGSSLQDEIVNGIKYWFPKDLKDGNANIPSVQLFPAFDEFVISYADRSHCLDSSHTKKVISSNGIFYPVVVVNGKVMGTWKRTFSKESVSIETNLFNPINDESRVLFDQAAGRYAIFLDKRLKL